MGRWVEGTEVSLISPDETTRLFEVVADTHSDTPIKLPMITLRKNNSYSVLVPIKRPMSYNGVRLKSTDGRNEQLTMIPISLQYQIDVYARHYREADEYMRNMVFNIINYPELQIEIPYENIKRNHVANIRIITDIMDNSAIPQRLNIGQFTRLSVGVSIDDAYLWDVRIKDTLRIAPSVVVENKEEKVDTDN